MFRRLGRLKKHFRMARSMEEHGQSLIHWPSYVGV